MASDVAPPSIQCSMWWAWHMIGGRVQRGKRQCWLVTAAIWKALVIRESLLAADVEDVGLGAQDGGDHVGVAAQPADRRGGEGLAGLGGPVAAVLHQIFEGHGQGDPWRGAVAFGQDLGGLQELAGSGEGVEHADAVVAGVAAVVGATGHRAAVGVAGRAVGGVGCGQGDQGGVLDGAAAFDPGAAGVVVGDGQVPGEVGGALESVQGLLVAAFVAVGVDDGEQVSGCFAQLGGVQGLGLGEQDLDAACAEVGVAGQGVDGAFDDVGLGGGEPALAHRCCDRGQHGVGEGGCEPHGGGAGAFVAAGGVGEVVLGARPAEWFDRTGGIELADHSDLEGVQGGLEGLDLGEEVHQLGWLVCCPECLGQFHRACAHAGDLGEEAAGGVLHE